MEVREFLEDDMKAFLDARLSVSFLREQSTQASRHEDSVTLFGKDYEKLLIEALNEHNIPKAKAVLHEVKDEFTSYPVGSPERQHLQALLHALYMKFKLHLEDETKLSKLETALDTIDSSPKTSAAVLDSDTHGLQFGRAEGADQEIEEALAVMDEAAKKPPAKKTENKTKEPSQPLPEPIPEKQTPAHPDAEFMPPGAKMAPPKPVGEGINNKPSSEPPVFNHSEELPAFPKIPVPPSADAQPVKKTPELPAAPERTLTEKTITEETPESPITPTPAEASPETVSEESIDSSPEPTPEPMPEHTPEPLPTEESFLPESAVLEPVEQESQSFANIMQQLDIKLQRKKLKESYWLYKEAKNQYLLLTKEQQTQYHQPLLDCHKKILTLMGKNQDAPSVLKPIEEDLVAAMRSGDLHEAMIHYEELRNEALNLPAAVQEEYVPRMQEYYQWILNSWKDWRENHTQNTFLEQHERRLSGRP